MCGLFAFVALYSKKKSEKLRMLHYTLRRFWAKMKSSVMGNQEKGKVCDESRQVLCEEKRLGEGGNST